jgi:hypothetical protein
MTVLWDVRQFSFVGRHQRFGEMFCLEMEKAQFYETLVIHGVISQKIIIFIENPDSPSKYQFHKLGISMHITYVQNIIIVVEFCCCITDAWRWNSKSLLAYFPYFENWKDAYETCLPVYPFVSAHLPVKSPLNLLWLSHHLAVCVCASVAFVRKIMRSSYCLCPPPYFLLGDVWNHLALCVSVCPSLLLVGNGPMLLNIIQRNFTNSEFAIIRTTVFLRITTLIWQDM